MKNGLLAIGQLSPRVIFSVNLSSNFIIFGTHIFKISKWSGVNFNQIRVRKKSLSGELQKTPPSEMDTCDMGRANMFWTVKTFNQENLECLGFIFTKYELYMYIHRKTTLNQYFQHGAAIIDPDRCFFKTCL